MKFKSFYKTGYQFSTRLGDTSTVYAQNICTNPDGTLRPSKGCTLTCKWIYDGQVFYHQRAEALIA